MSLRRDRPISTLERAESAECSCSDCWRHVGVKGCERRVFSWRGLPEARFLRKAYPPEAESSISCFGGYRAHLSSRRRQRPLGFMSEFMFRLTFCLCPHSSNSAGRATTASRTPIARPATAPGSILVQPGITPDSFGPKPYVIALSYIRKGTHLLGRLASG